MVKLKLNTNAEPFEVELSGNCVIVGRTGSGKTVLLSSFIDQFRSNPDVDVHVIDAKGYEYDVDTYKDSNIKMYNEENATDALVSAFNESTKPEHKEQIVIVDEYQAITDRSFFDMLDQLIEMNEYGIHVILSSQGVTPEVIYNIDQFDLRLAFECDEDVLLKVFYSLRSFYTDHHYLAFRVSTWSVADCKQEVLKHGK